MSQIVHNLPVLGTRIASVTYDEAVTIVLDAAKRRERGYVCACNVHSVSMARRDENYRRVLNQALLAVPDGTPLVWAHRLLGGRRLRERVYGPTLMLRLCEAAAGRGVKVYLYGSTPEVLKALTENLLQRFPALEVVGTCSPPFAERAPADPQLQRELEAINASGAQLVFVGLGAPKQELFMAQQQQAIQGVQVGVGAAFDFHAGRSAQAPGWLQALGLEWLFRLCCEPRRLWRRYLLYNPYFVARLLLQFLGLDGPSRQLSRELTQTQASHVP